MPSSYLYQTNPELQLQWDSTQNEKPFNTVTSQSPTGYHWVCENKHSWIAPAYARAKGNGCPFCTNRKVLPGFNDLATTNPELLSQWHPTLNSKTPMEVVPGTAQVVWWVCTKGHEWEARVNSRTKQNQGCPFCVGLRAVPGETDLASQYPDVAKQLHPTLNGKIDATQIHQNANKKLWWLGECGHEWETSVRMRTQKKSRCTVCHRMGGNRISTPNVEQIDRRKTLEGETVRRVTIGVNDLASRYPEVAMQWHPVKNGRLTPFDVASKSSEKVWWLGRCGHYWDRSVRKQVDFNSCPYCTGHRVGVGVNDFKTTHPDSIKFFKGTVNPTTEVPLSATSSVLSSWVCDKGHEWEATIAQYHSSKVPCPICGKRKVATGVNDLKTTHPELVTEWHPQKNGVLEPSDIMSSSTRNVWWECNKGHEWENSPHNRAYIKPSYRRLVPFNGCPFWSYTTSVAEKEIFDFVHDELGFTQAIQNERKILGGKEIDIYIPSLKIGIEYNGLYWHKESQGKGQNYHLRKWIACKEQGIQLIQIWEDDWLIKKDLWKRMLAYKLGKSSTKRVYARKTSVKEFEYSEVKEYMEENHLQGAMFGTAYYGLVDETNVLVSLMVVTLKQGGRLMEITRFLSSNQVVGGFSKLLKFALSTHKDVKEVISFSENSISVGELYEKNGFGFVSHSNSYSYISQTQPPVRLHRRNFTKQKYHEREDLEFVEGLTERELAELNGLDRVWEAGNTKWVLKL